MTATQKSRKRWFILPFLWRFMKFICMSLGFILLLSIIVSLFVFKGIIDKQATVKPLPNEIVLLWNLEGPPAEHENINPSFGFTEKQMTMRALIASLEKAAEDTRVKGLVTHVKGGTLSLSEVQELAPVIEKFKGAGKFSYIFAPSYSDGGGGIALYALAAQHTKIYMQPLGTLSISGIRAEVPFARDAIDKLGVEPEFYARKEYKSVFSSITDNEMTEASREALQSIVQDLGHQITNEVISNRDFTALQFKSYIDQALFLDKQAVSAGLIDELLYFDDLTLSLQKTLSYHSDNPNEITNPDFEYISLEKYYGRIKRPNKTLEVNENSVEKKPSVTVLYAIGNVIQNAGDKTDALLAADKLSKSIRTLSDDKDVKAIILRVVSPGGSATASETILHSLKHAQGQGKIVVVSMGSMAASGGYWISTGADQIFALPATLTGSIGVAGGKVALEDLWRKIGVNWDTVEWGENAGLWSVNEPWNKHNVENINAMLDQVYDAFILRVAEGRGMSLQAADRVARGRVWTGAQAVNAGLVDQLGGLNDALDYVAVQLGKETRKDLQVNILPRVKTPWEQIFELFETQVTMGEHLGVLSNVLEAVEPVIKMREAQDFNVYQDLKIKQ